MEPILKTIAREYSKRYKDLKKICFLFPNKRCRIFLTKYLAEYGIKTEGLPHILTISELTAQIARKTEASRIEQLLGLYKAYLEIIDAYDSLSVEFEEFRSWGETVLADFNIVDLSLVDPDEIFKNVNDIHEIATNFLTEDQKEVMKEYFGSSEFGDTASFWKNFENPNELSDLKKKFLNLWQVLSPLHDKFIKVLEEQGLGTNGSIYREAVEKVKKRGKSVFPYQKIVAVGFNALTESERQLFIELKNIEGYPGYDSFADFIWDSGGTLLKNENLTASRFIAYNLRHFPMPGWIKPLIEESDSVKYPAINIISAPGLTSQAKVAHNILLNLDSPEEKKSLANAEVALVLPDESLLSNILYSLPEEIGQVNLTMGYTFRQTSIVSFISLLRRLYSSIRETNDTVSYYCKDLKLFLSHPYSRLLFEGEKIDSLLGTIKKFHKISIDTEEIAKLIPEFKEIINLPSKKVKGDEIFNFLEVFLQKLQTQIVDSDIQSDRDSEKLLDVDQIQIYSEYVSGLKEALKKYNVIMSPLHAMLLIDKLISSEKIGFEGEPLSGLQIMGTLETRVLDFKEVIILSMNEGIMPRKVFNSTFIPETLRKAYGIPPARYAEEIFGYYFYRLLGRAEKVTLIYDGRTVSGLRGGESRYLIQLRRFLPQGYIKEELWQFPLQNKAYSVATITKTPELMEKIQDFSESGVTRKNFSASSLNTYRECQVRFFLRNVLNIDSDPEKGEFMDPISIGVVLHNVMMELYLPTKKQKILLTDPVEVKISSLQGILNHPEQVRTLVIKYINQVYYKNNDINHPIESGVSDIIASQITDLVLSIVNYDLTLAPFNIYGAEISEELDFTLQNGRRVNFRFAIDRLDEITVDGEKHLRIVDYKTGIRKRSAKNLQEVFNGGYESEQIFQLFCYAWLLGKRGFNGWEDVITEIYYVPDLIKRVGGLPELGGEKVTSFRPYVTEFSKNMENMIESIFSSPTFKEPEDSETCNYCPFITFCNK